MKHYQELQKQFKTISNISGAKAILHWDFACMMPSGASDIRAEQLATLNIIEHELITGKKVRQLLDKAENETKYLDGWQKQNLALMKHSWIHANAVDPKIIEELSKAGTECEVVWRDAKKNNAFKTYLPYQQKVLNLVRELAQAKGAALGCSPYDALLDQFDMGNRVTDIDIIFNDLKKFLPKFLQQVLNKQSGKESIQPKGPFPIEKQKELSLKLMKSLGFDFNNGRIDVSHHPFCGGVPGDVRITTVYKLDNFTPSLMATLHETGHALYESNLPKKWYDQPVGCALGMSVHESQSLLIEMQACRSPEFLEYLSPLLIKYFPRDRKAWRKDNLVKIYSAVKPGAIRIQADEVTYPLHVILRYEIEKLLIGKKLEMRDVPEVWNEKMEQFFGIKIKNYKDGCMQDIHWTDGAFGYFPNYTLGAMIAAQLFDAAKRAHPEIPKKIRKGDFSVLMDWLAKNVHNLGSRYSKDEMLKKATGQKLNPEIYKNHLTQRYLSA